MQNSVYWKNRFELLEETQNSVSEKYVEVLKEEYDKALVNIEKDITMWYTRIANNNEISYTKAKELLSKQELKEFKWTIKEYIQKGKENAINQKWIKELENASAKVHINRLEAIKIQIQNELEQLQHKQNKDTTELLKKQYKDAYYKSSYEIQKGMDKYWNIQALDNNRIEKIISKPWTTDNKTFSDRIWQKKEQLINTLQKDLTQATIRGEDLQKVINKISKDFKVSKNRAGTLIMTESAFFSSIGQKECFNNLKVEKFEIVATLDSHTSEICQEMDRKVFEMKDYEVGITAPPFHCNCRSTTVPYFDDEFTIGEQRAGRDENGSSILVPQDMTYKEWKEKYVTNGNKDDIINNIPNFKKSLTKGQQKVYTLKEIKQIAQQTNEIANKYTNNESKWSGKIIESKRKMNAKLWNCNIEIERLTSPHAILHEHLHAHSISYYDRETYRKYDIIEEATVEFYTKEIGKKENIINIKSEYDGWVENLKMINRKIKIGKDDLEFAQKLFNVPVIQRIDFLEAKIQEYLIDKSINEAMELNKLMEVFYGE